MGVKRTCLCAILLAAGAAPAFGQDNLPLPDPAPMPATQANYLYTVPDADIDLTLRPGPDGRPGERTTLSPSTMGGQAPGAVLEIPVP